MNSSKSLKNLLLLVLIALLLDESSRLLRPLLRSLDYNVASFFSINFENHYNARKNEYMSMHIYCPNTYLLCKSLELLPF